MLDIKYRLSVATVRSFYNSSKDKHELYEETDYYTYKTLKELNDSLDFILDNKEEYLGERGGKIKGFKAEKIEKIKESKIDV